MKDRDQFVIGVDFGTDSVRSVIVNARDGAEIASSICTYPRWKDGLFCQPEQNQFRQHPLDYTEGLEATITQALQKAGPKCARSVKGISIDTTGSTPVAVDRSGTPVALLDGFQTNPNAMFVLWKDHTAVREAAELNAHAGNFKTNYLKFVGGIYSSEWFWAKLLHVLRADSSVRSACHSWVEHCDWIPFLLTGGKHVDQMRRGICAAGHKALWADEFGGLPPDDFFSSWDPVLAGFSTRMMRSVSTSDQPAGKLCDSWADRLGLPGDVIVGIGAFDAHMGAVGGQIEAYHLSKVMGTSTCDMLVAPLAEVEGKLVRGICGQVPGSVIPGMMGMEAGQSAFGDTYAWFRDLISWPLRQLQNISDFSGNSVMSSAIDNLRDGILSELGKEAATRELTEHLELSLDWLNGRRTPDANQQLRALISGLSLGSDAPGIYRSLVEATCFGARAIVDRFNGEGIAVKGLIGLGGVARKSPFIMQMLADILGMPIRIHRSEQTCAMGAAMFAATAANIYPRVEEAMAAMGQGFDREYIPDPSLRGIYDIRYNKYKSWGKFAEGSEQ
jgi:L-ribulokinase